MSSGDDADDAKPKIPVRAIDHYAHNNRWRDRHPAEKLTFAFGLMAAALGGAPLVAAPLALATATASTVWGAGIPGRVLLAALAVPTGFIATGAPMLMVGVDGGGLHLHPEGLPQALALALRALAAAACLIFLALTTPLADLARLLARMRVPAPLIDLMLLTYRFVFIVAETAHGARAAQAARLGYHGARRGWRSIGLLASTLLQRALARAQAMEIGLAARGYDDGFAVLGRRWRSSGSAWVAIIATPLAILVVGALA